MGHFSIDGDSVVIDVQTLATSKELACYHGSFRQVQASPWRQKLMFARMHANRLFQTAYIVAQSPAIWGKVLGTLGHKARGASTLRGLEIATTYACNAHCSQCSCRLAYDRTRERTEKMTLDEFKGVIDQAVEMGAFQFAINGGEPMIEEETVYELIRYIKGRYGAHVHLSSNGYLLTAEKIRTLAEYGLDSAEMGFDSAFEASHDQNRLRGSYGKVLENIKLFRDQGILVILNTVLTNDKVCSDDIILTHLVAKTLGCLLQITPACLTGAFKNRFDLMLTEEAKLYFHWLLALSWHNRSDLYSSLSKIKCPAAREKVGLQPYGDVVSCPLIQISYGNIREASLREIQARMLENPFYHLKETQGCLPAMSEDFIRTYLSDDPESAGSRSSGRDSTSKTG